MSIAAVPFVRIIGSRGQLGAEVVRACSLRGIPYAAADVDTEPSVDVVSEWSVHSFLGDERGGWIVNCAAYTSVDDAEDHPDDAAAVNATGPGIVAAAARALDATFIHVSTDYVFDGASRMPYREEDAPAPRNVYGATKLDGERAAAREWCKLIILRTAWLYGGMGVPRPGCKQGSNFVRTMLRLFAERGEARVVDDQWGNPTYARDLAGAIVEIIVRGVTAYGVYHCVNAGCATRFEFAEEILHRGRDLGLVTRTVTLTPVATADYPTRATRPANSCLDTGKLRSVVGVSMRNWREALQEYLRELRDASAGRSMP